VKKNIIKTAGLQFRSKNILPSVSKNFRTALRLWRNFEFFSSAGEDLKVKVVGSLVNDFL
jgi:hypothetical protein